MAPLLQVWPRSEAGNEAGNEATINSLIIALSSTCSGDLLMTGEGH